MNKRILIGGAVVFLLIFVPLYYFFSKPEPLNNRIKFIPKDYIELDDVIGHEEEYAGKTFSLRGNIVRWPGFQIYFKLLSDEMIKNSLSPHSGLSVYSKDIEQFVRYEYGEDQKYNKRQTGPNGPILIRGKLVDHGWRTDANRYSFEISEYEVVKENLKCNNKEDCENVGLECPSGKVPTCYNHDARGLIAEPNCTCMEPNIEW